MVYPDNRRPVNYARRAALLRELKREFAKSPDAFLHRLSEPGRHEEAKLFLTWRALCFRRAHRELFAEGDYLSVPVLGDHPEHICAFARRLGSEWMIAAVPRWLTALKCEPPVLRENGWTTTSLEPPAPAPSCWKNVLTGKRVSGLSIPELLSSFPVALLHGSR